MEGKRQKRIRLLDIFRGFAILGTLGTNIWIFAYLGDLNYIFTLQHDWMTSFDVFLRTLSLTLINGKLLGLLAIMFGVGLQLKYQQSIRRGRAWPGVYLWICLILFIEGFLHFTFVMEYDILMSYAITAVIVSFIVKAGERTIKWAMIGFGSIHVLIYTALTCLLIYIQSLGGKISLGDMSHIVKLYQHGTWWEQVLYRITDFWLLRIEVVLAFASNIFLFLTGVMLMRKGAFASDERGRKIRRKMLKYGLVMGLPLNFLLFIPGGFFDLMVRYVFSPLLSIGYMGLIAWLVEKRDQLRLWRWLEYTGKMSLSCYIFQNLLCTATFYGWGLGLGGKLNSISILLIWLLVSLIQICFATLWQRYAQLGPMEAGRKAILRLVTNGRT